MAAVFLRAPRFAGQTLDAWLDTLGPVEDRDLRAVLDQHPTRASLASAGPGVLKALEREIRATARIRVQANNRYRHITHAWVALGRWFPNRLGVSPPQRDQDLESWTQRRLVWSAALLLVLSPDLPSGMDRLDATVAKLPAHLRLPLSPALEAVTDDSRQQLSSALAGRLRTERTTMHPFWVACLGHLGSQATRESDLVRTLAREADPETRREALAALGQLDTRPDAVQFIMTNATDAESRRGAMLALMRLGPRAEPARAFLTNALRDQDMLTSIFAKWALDKLDGETAAP